MAGKAEGTNSGEQMMLLGLLVGLVGLALFQNASRGASRVHYDKTRNSVIGVVLHERPTTALGGLLVERMKANWRLWAMENRAGARRLPRLEVIEQSAVDQSVILMNRWMRLWPIFLSLSLALTAFPRVPRRFGALSHWPKAVLIASGMITLTGAVGLALFTPASWFLPAQLLAGLLAVSNLIMGLVCLALALNRQAPPKTLHHGPPFETPARDGKCFEIGMADHRILPAHAHWLADGGGPIAIPFNRLSCGITILGEKGSGKSRLLFAIHDAIRQSHPNVPILIHDPKGEWYRTYYDKDTDIYFAPHFNKSAAWSLWNDFKAIPELRHELIASSVHAHPMPNGSFWMDQAVELLETSIADDEFEDAVRRLAMFPRDHADDKFQLSIYGTARLAFLDLAKVHLMAKNRPAGAPAPLGIKDFLEKRKRRIFLLNDPSCATQQHGAFSLFLSAFLLRALSMDDVPAGTLRAVAILDEALTFNLPPDVDRRLYTLCRSKGICLIAGSQRLPDHRRHERAEWETAEYTLALKVMNQDTQKSLSQRAGSLFFREKTTSTSVNNAGGSRTESPHDLRTDVFPPEHFGRLAPREFLLFHDRGLVTGRTLDVCREQQKQDLPTFNARSDVREVSKTLMGQTNIKKKQGPPQEKTPDGGLAPSFTP